MDRIRMGPMQEGVRAQTAMPRTGPSTVSTTRVTGGDAFTLGVNISRFVFPDIDVRWRPNMAVLAPLEECQSAIVAASLVHHPHNGPLLLTHRDRLHPLVAEELVRLQLTGLGTENKQPLRAQVFLVGNFDPGVEQQVQRLGYQTMRISAPDYPQIAANVLRLRRALNQQIEKRTKDVLIASVEDCRDVLPGPGFAAHSGVPFLLVTKQGVPAATREALRELGNPSAHIIGTTRTVPEQVEHQLGQMTEGRIIRVGGTDPFETAVNLARYISPDGKVGWGRVQQDGHTFSFAPSNVWPPAILIGVASHMAKHAPVLLLPPDGSVPHVLKEYLLSVNPPLVQPPGPPFMHGIIAGDMSLITWEQQLVLDKHLTKEAGDEIPPEKHG